MYSIYLITDSTNNKVYVGQTKYSIETRFRDHLNCSIKVTDNNRFHNAIRSHGPENFSVMLLEDNIDESNADAREIFWISKYKSNNPDFGYNSTIGGGGVKGYHHSQETKDKISKSLTGHVFPESRNEKIREAMTNRYFPQVWKDKLSEIAKQRVGEKNSFYGRHHTDETKLKYVNSMGYKKVAKLDPNTLDVIDVYNTVPEAARWLIDNNLSKFKERATGNHIHRCCLGHSNYEIEFGFIWKYIERCND